MREKKDVSTVAGDREKQESQKDAILPEQKSLLQQKNMYAEHEQDSSQDVLYVGQQEYEMLRMQSYLQHEILAHWRPPIGVPAQACCEISFVVDWAGIVNNVAVVSSSGVLMYDVSARSALLAMDFPGWAKGKSFKISFKQ